MLQHLVAPSGPHGVGIYLSTYAVSDCGTVSHLERAAPTLTHVEEKNLPHHATNGDELRRHSSCSVNATWRRGGAALRALQIGPFREEEVKLPPHRFEGTRGKQKLLGHGLLERLGSQYRLRRRVAALTAADAPEVALLVRPDMQPCSTWQFVEAAPGQWGLRVRGCLNASLDYIRLNATTIVLPRSRKHPGFIDDTIAAGTLGAMHRLVAFHAALQRGIYSNMSMAELSAALGDRPGVEHGIFAEGLLEMHLRRAGLHVRTTGFDKKQAGRWEMGECVDPLEAARRRRRGAAQSTKVPASHVAAPGPSLSPLPSPRRRITPRPRGRASKQ